MIRFLIALSLVGVLAGCASSGHLNDAALNDVVDELRAQHKPGKQEHVDATFFLARDHLRNWMEARLAGQRHGLKPDVFAARLNAALRAANLLCGDHCETIPGEFDNTGYLDEIETKRIDDYLMVKTHLGVLCGYDSVGYLYHWERGKWVRLWESAHGLDPDGSYQSEYIDTIAYDHAGKNLLVATAGYNPWCTSAWRKVSYRLWERKDARLLSLINESAFAYIGGEDGPLGLSLRPNRLVMVYHAASLDPAVHNRLVVRHFRIVDGKAEPAPPYALTARDFVEEWLARDWSFAVAQIAPEQREALHAAHARYASETPYGEFLGPTHRCQDAGWEVGIRFLDRNTGGVKGERVFRVVKTGPGVLRIASVAEEFSDHCATEDSSADDADAQRDLVFANP